MTIMNIHVKIWDEETSMGTDAPDPRYEEIAELITKYGCEKHCYVMTASDKRSKEFHKIAPDIRRCVGWDGNIVATSMPRRAIELGADTILTNDYLRVANAARGICGAVMTQSVLTLL